MDLNLAGKTVIVTGGGSVIGRSICLGFAREGATVVIAEIDETQGEKTAAEAERAGAKAVVSLRADVTRWEDVQGLVRAVEQRFGGVDVLVNNVGWTREGLFVEKVREEWEREIQLNLWSVINCSRAVLDGMIARRSGAIVNISSDAGRIGEFREAVYGASKGGVIALAKTLAREVGRHGIRVNVVCPGTTMPDSDEEVGSGSMWKSEELRAWNTPDMRARIGKLYPLRRVGRPADIAPAVVFLASDAAAFITGQTLSVSGGYTMM
jgi:2-hydroxycyclohexanecarboxyl-CoA dehydrogenase